MIFSNIANFALGVSLQNMRSYPLSRVSCSCSCSLCLVHPIVADERTKLDFRRNQSEVQALHAARMLKFRARMYLKDTLTWILTAGNPLQREGRHRGGAIIFALQLRVSNFYIALICPAAFSFYRVYEIVSDCSCVIVKLPLYDGFQS